MAGIYRRDKIYWGRVQRAGREHRRSLKTSNRAIAEKRFGFWIGELEGIAFGEKPRRGWQEASERFIREHLTTLKPSGARRYGVSLKNLAMHLHSKTLDQIGTAVLSEFETARRSDGVTAGTIRRDLACLSSLLTSAIDWEWIDINPVPGYLRRRSKRGLKEAPARTRYLTEAEEERLLSHATPASRIAITLAIDTGPRLEEMFALTWCQIDMLRSIIATTTRTKSGRLRSVPLPARSAQILAQIPRAIDCPYVLINPDTGTRYVAMEKGFKAAARRAKITDVRWHDLRRTSGCRWLQRDGKSMEEVSILLGHSSVTVTEKSYAFLEGEVVAESLSGRTPGRHTGWRSRCVSEGVAMTYADGRTDSDSVNLGSNPSSPAKLIQHFQALPPSDKPDKTDKARTERRTEPGTAGRPASLYSMSIESAPAPSGRRS